jgi:hypothetical protein
VEFHEGEAWHYKTRPGEDASVLIIGRIDQFDGQTAIHIQVRNLSIPNGQGTAETIGHLPISETALQESVTSRTEATLDERVFEEGYAEWRRAQGGVWDLTVSELIDSVARLVQ